MVILLLLVGLKQVLIERGVLFSWLNLFNLSSLQN